MTRVLVTRAARDAEAFCEMCRVRGLAPIAAPVMEIKTHRKDLDLSGVVAVAFTSVNGVRSFAANNKDRTLPVFAVGPVTAAAAREAGFGSVLVADGDVEALAAAIVESQPRISGEILHIAGANRAGDLAALLAGHGIVARRETLYAARALPALAPEVVAGLTGAAPIEWVSFFSPRTMRLFLNLVRNAGAQSALANVRAACLSDAVADAANTVQWRGVHIAPMREAASLADMIASARHGSTEGLTNGA